VVNWVPVHVESRRKEEMLVKVALGTTANQYFLLGSAQIDTGGMLFIQECSRILIPYQPVKVICRHQVVAKYLMVSTFPSAYITDFQCFLITKVMSKSKTSIEQ